MQPLLGLLGDLSPGHEFLHLILYAAWAPPVILPMTVVSSNMMILVFSWEATQSYVKRVYSRGLSTQPWGVPLLTVLVLEVRRIGVCLSGGSAHSCRGLVSDPEFYFRTKRSLFSLVSVLSPRSENPQELTTNRSINQLVDSSSKERGKFKNKSCVSYM